MPYDTSLLNFYRPLRGPRWRGDFIKYSRRKSRRCKCGDPAVTADAPSARAIPPPFHHPVSDLGRPKPPVRSVKPGGAGLAPGAGPGRSGPGAAPRGAPASRQPPPIPGYFQSSAWRAPGAFENLALDVSSTWRSRT